MYKEIIKNLKPSLDKILDKIRQEISILRTGTASPGLLENVMIDCYNSRMPLIQLAAINLRDARTLIIQPWDKAIIKNIEKGIIGSVPGLSSAVEGDIIRVNLPSPSEETRKNLVKSLHHKLEEGRMGIRQAREVAWKQIQDFSQAGKIREDDKFRAKDELQKLVDEYNNKIKEMGEKKEKDIMTV
ncbi:MAG: ribosome recycling factor [Candidatus Portnoybacteria bacterium RBG_19FT_COMBO_36_7]|uniref:Ribosome-recycling factor n=1 Tax=Candidatus Portnoybacteria bacterium RBG_19FT_COMBO_36_7 TaxID=1801992 RepID=A0A1G2F9S9_9BACT|nr:MAG: ribosome recycling factor [Candidatus Portnoybacteria bacterium RBG_19FT_COMBO_36_7]